MKSKLRIGNAQAFWGDSPEAPARLLKQQPNLDFLTLDYLAEVSLSILAGQKARDPSAGYARDFVDVVRSLAPAWKAGSKLRVVTNAGGLNPETCAHACRQALQAAGCGRLQVCVVLGDDVLKAIRKRPSAPCFRNSETGEPASAVYDRLVSANAYLGAREIAEAVAAGADLIITGRVSDPSLTLGPCAARFGWRWNDFNRLAAGMIAGHLIECGTQVTGGICTDWLNVPRAHEIGFPVLEMHEDGSLVVTKPARSGGMVTLQTVKEQLLYEVGDPSRFIGPDVIASLLTLKLKSDGKDRIAVHGARGAAPTEFYKVSATYHDGFKAHGSLVIYGADAEKKARKAGEALLKRLENSGAKPARSLVECVGSGACAPGSPKQEGREVLLRVSVADPRRQVVEHFSRQMASLITSGPPGTTGYAAGRPRVQEVFGFWPCLIEKDALKAAVVEVA